MVFNLSGIPLAGLNRCGGSLPYRKGNGVLSSQQNREVKPINLPARCKEKFFNLRDLAVKKTGLDKGYIDIKNRIIALLSELIVKRFVKTKI